MAVPYKAGNSNARFLHSKQRVLNANQVIKELKASGTPSRAKASAWYFKTGKGQYGYGDVFWGISVPRQRQIASRYSSLPPGDIRKLLRHKVHECRLTALFILVHQYKKETTDGKKRIAKFYLSNLKRINNWDLVDSSAPTILGNYLADKPRAILYKLAVSKNIWERRIAILATFAFIREQDYADTLAIARLLLNDPHDLIHKAAGWALREVGNKSLSAEEAFLKKYSAVMPRTMLRYAIEKFPEAKRKAYLRRRKTEG